MSDLDECKCGDYRRSHESGTGRCLLCAWNPANPLDPCMKFELHHSPMPKLPEPLHNLLDTLPGAKPRAI